MISNDPVDQEYNQIFTNNFVHVDQHGIELILDNMGRPIYADELEQWLQQAIDAMKDRHLSDTLAEALKQQDPITYLKKVKELTDSKPLPML